MRDLGTKFLKNVWTLFGPIHHFLVLTGFRMLNFLFVGSSDFSGNYDNAAFFDESVSGNF